MYPFGPSQTTIEVQGVASHLRPSLLQNSKGSLAADCTMQSQLWADRESAENSRPARTGSRTGGTEATDAAELKEGMEILRV
jgi:hypothetical protein